jgi:hypothetical protein
LKSAGGAFENRQTIRPSLPGLDDILSADPIFGRRFAAENNRPKSRSTKWQAGNKKSVLEITDQPSFNIIMRKALFYLLPLIWITHLGFAQEQPFPVSASFQKTWFKTVFGRFDSTRIISQSDGRSLKQAQGRYWLFERPCPRYRLARESLLPCASESRRPRTRAEILLRRAGL